MMNRAGTMYSNSAKLLDMKRALAVVLMGMALQTHAQNVGIGNTAPGYRVDVSGRMRIRGGNDLFNSAGVYLGGVATDSLTIKALMGMASDTSVGFYGYSGGGWGFTMDLRNGNAGIGEGTPLNKAGFTVNNKVGSVNAIFGSNTSGVAIESSFPGIGFNTYLNGTRKLLFNGYGAYIGSSHVSGGLQFAVTTAVDFAGSTVTPATAMDIKPNGNIGIGVTDQAYRLDVAGRMRVRSGGDNNTSAGIYFNTNANTAPGAFVGMQTDNQVGFWGSGNGWSFVVNTTNGNVGIGTVSSHAPLQLGNGVVSRKIVLYESADNDHQFYGFGVNSSVLRYQTAGPGDDHVFYSGAGAGASTELMRIKGNGNTGIGNSDPAYRLDVSGRMRLRADGSSSAGIWFNNLGNTEVRGFVGMYDNDLIGIYGDAGGGWSFAMSTSNGNIQMGHDVMVYGSITTNGYTKLGDTGPAIKTKLITGNTPLAGEALLPHGLDKTKIIGYQASVTTVDGVLVLPGYWFGVGLSYQVQIDNNNVRVVLPLNPLDYGLIINKPIKIYITYTE